MEAKAILGVRITPTIKQQLAEVAKAQHRTSSNLVEWLIKQYLDQVTQQVRETSPSTMEIEFAKPDEVQLILTKRRPAIAATLDYLQDK